MCGQIKEVVPTAFSNDKESWNGYLCAECKDKLDTQRPFMAPLPKS